MKLAFDFRPAAVLGGGPSLASDYAQLPPNCTLIAVNNHPFEIGITPHVLVHQDKLRNVYEVAQAVKNFKGVVISPWENSHLPLPPNAWRGDFSSSLATWYALWCDFNPVILCGMDLYQGKVKYCHPRPGVDHVAWHAPLEGHLKYWRQAFRYCPHPERIRAMSGPLIELFGRYENPSLIPQDLGSGRGGV
jgi:hypothetical protein